MGFRPLALAVAVLALTAAAAAAAPGDLDTSFDGDGKQTVDHGGSDQATDVLVQPDGKVFLAGAGGANPLADFIVSRLNSNGSLDTSFDVDGRNYVDLGGSDGAAGAALQADGKIVVAGATALGSNVVVMRFNADASLDNGFDPGGAEGAGIRVIDYGDSDSAEGVLIQPDVHC